jgi:hypothetical protein
VEQAAVFSTAEVARLLGVHPAILNKLCLKGVLKPPRLGAVFAWGAQDILEARRHVVPGRKAGRPRKAVANVQ